MGFEALGPGEKAPNEFYVVIEIPAYGPPVKYEVDKETGALFVAATCAGAESAGADPMPWRALGDCLGEAYQVADDIRDVIGQSAELGKPTGQDAQHGRPSVAHELGLSGAIGYFENLIDRAVDAVPQVASADKLRQIVRMESERLVPSSICQSYKSAASSLQH